MNVLKKLELGYNKWRCKMSNLKNKVENVKDKVDKR